ncbi:metalloregulator ArsR/SmtB family transcription factor [Streptomyces sp. NPDC049099]|uniref:ArsR/SmtB family transcription factor n=1 Tax=Streptomyces sp. NPDC049099 TaxID=3155768 RepID=UPI003424803C
MHLVPADRADRRTIDGHRVCEAIAAIGDADRVRTWAGRFSLLADAKRLALLLALHRTGPLAVSDLAVATGMNDPAVSQALRLLRAAGVVAGEKQGRVVRYRVVDAELRAVLDLC